MTKLNPCPNCGSEPDIGEMADCFIVDCISCDGAVNQCRSRSASGAMNAWNAATSDGTTTQSDKTLRDEFAMAALTGILAYPESDLKGSYYSNSNHSYVAELAYLHADAMLKERNK